MSPCQEAKRGCAKDLGGGNWRGTGLATSIRGLDGLIVPRAPCAVVARSAAREVEIVCEVPNEVRPLGPTIGVDLGVNTVMAATDGKKAIAISGREIKATIQLRNKQLAEIVSKQAKKV